MDKVFPEGAALVFGGTGGLGSASVREMARAGSDIALCYRSKQNAAETLADEFRGLGRRVSLHRVDATDPESLMTARDEAIEVHGRIHTLVWAAGPLVDQLYLS